jgi:hypothetical protein
MLKISTGYFPSGRYGIRIPNGIMEAVYEERIRNRKQGEG